MYLKTLELTGFKSFADRTRLELRPGVTVVVGPNGSGKSNIVEAVAWVLGSQSPKSLRADRMDDVIFAGTATRPALGRAEVRLVIDNESGALPIELSEVAITRRLYRDGSSDYELNGVGCRLLDIQELLSDSGVGRHQHVIVGQGRIESILNADPLEHRAVIEEAAGILKHRVRKDRSLRRLESSEADLSRLTDLAGEIARQMRPLKRQAAAANRHHELAAEVRSLRLFLGGEELREIDSRRVEVEDRAAEVARRLVETEGETIELSAVAAILRREADTLGEALDRDSTAAAGIEAAVERLRRVASVARERRRAEQATLEGAGLRRRDLEDERRRLEAASTAVAAEEDDAGRRVEGAERRFRELEAEERSLADQEASTVDGAVARARGELRAMDSAEERDLHEAEAVERRLEVLGGQLAADRVEIERVGEEVRRLDVEVGTAQGRYQVAEGRRRQEQGAWERAETDLAEATVETAAARARVEALEQALSGDHEARRSTAGAPGALGGIEARLDVPSDLLSAVAAALGPWSGAIVFAGPEMLEAAVGALKGSGGGGVPMVAPGSEVGTATAREVAAGWGLEALADLLGPGADPDLADRLLGDVVVAEGWASGARVVRRHPGVRVVTPDGDLVTAEGIAVARPDPSTPGMLEAAVAAAGEAGVGLARARSLAAQTRRSFESARAEERAALEALEALEARLAGSSEALARLERAAEAVAREIERLDRRREALSSARAARAEERLRLVERLEALEGEEAEGQRVWVELAERRRLVASEREGVRAAWQEASALQRGAGERRRMIESRLEAIAGELAYPPPADPDRVARLEAVESAARRALEALEIHLGALRVRQAEERSMSSVVRARLSMVGERLGVLRSAAEADRERRSALAVESAELRVRREAVLEALRRDADAGEEEALAVPPPPEGDAQALLEARSAELRRMGPVNPLAAEAYADLEERHRLITGQVADVERSRRELRGVIRALEEEMEGRFLAAFEETATAFERHFSLLFPGGRGGLRLTDADAPLTSGVEIEAQPGGKRLARLAALSGGERSLAALAFLFAVFEARPSPFYLLDEVEAALDDANLRRFLRLLDAFRANAQLVVVTHQQQTMEAADVLYGVTMQPGGASQVVARRLEALTGT